MSEEFTRLLQVLGMTEEEFNEALSMSSDLLNADETEFDRLPTDHPLRVTRLMASLAGLVPEDGEEITPEKIRAALEAEAFSLKQVLYQSVVIGLTDRIRIQLCVPSSEIDRLYRMFSSPGEKKFFGVIESFDYCVMLNLDHIVHYQIDREQFPGPVLRERLILDQKWTRPLGEELLVFKKGCSEPEEIFVEVDDYGEPFEVEQPNNILMFSIDTAVREEPYVYVNDAYDCHHVFDLNQVTAFVLDSEHIGGMREDDLAEDEL